MRPRIFGGNLLVQFSLISFVIMAVLAAVLSVVVGEVVSRSNQDLQEQAAAIVESSAGSVEEAEMPRLGGEAGRVRWVIVGAIGVGFLYLYFTLVYMVWEGWRTIRSQQQLLEQTNAAIGREQRALQAIQESITEGLVVVDHQGRIRYCNQTGARVLGTEANQVLGRLATEFFQERAGALESPKHAAALGRLATGDPQPPAKLDVTLAAPQLRSLEVSSFHIPSGSDPGMTGLLVRDVTEERDLRTRRDNFVSIASHELRTPMTAIMGYSELLLSRQMAPDMQRQWLDRIHRNSKQLTAIIDDLLNVSRIQSGRIVINPEAVQLNAIIEDSVLVAKSMTEKHTFDVAIAPDTPEVWADRDKLSQIFTNLVSNAVKYSPNGGLIKVVTKHEPDQSRVVVSVADQGMGIAPKDRDQLFSTFYRVKRPETDGIRGTGLGLYIVKGLIELMGGTVWLESELNKGTTFYFTVPEAKPGQAQGKDESRTYPRASETPSSNTGRSATR